MSTAAILVVEHQATCPPAWVGEWLAAAGAETDLRRPYAGDDLPADLSGHRSLLVLGGQMNAHDDATFPWLTRVKELFAEAARDGVPALGICLGHQLAVVALGGDVGVNPRGQQIGVLDVGWQHPAAQDPLLGAVSAARVSVQWNDDLALRLPDGATVLACTPAGEVQAARLAPTVWGVQSHPEAGEEVVRLWAEHDRERAVARGFDVDAYVDQVAAARDELRGSWRPLATRFAELERRTVDA